MRKLQHVDVTNGHLLLESVATKTVIKHSLSGLVNDLRQSQFASAGTRLLKFLLDLFFGGAVKHRRGEMHAQDPRRPTKVRLENLAHVHSRWPAQGVQNDLDRGSVRKIRHIFFRQDARDDALITVAAGHLVTD